MRSRGLFITSLLVCPFSSPLFSQLPPVKTDPLRPTQVIQGTAGCSPTEASSCAQAAAKITPVVMGDSPLEENLRRLTDDVGGRVTGSPEMAKAVDWAVAAFRDGDLVEFPVNIPIGAMGLDSSHGLGLARSPKITDQSAPPPVIVGRGRNAEGKADGDQPTPSGHSAPSQVQPSAGWRRPDRWATSGALRQ